ncbi:MFS transporter [Streptomyces sp. NPDC005438]|uniref:MFS transporter n=1 Tax=Streptomyces sp. NPDC005438 TaxID=3156880 RepID=UPI0033A11FFC
MTSTPPQRCSPPPERTEKLPLAALLALTTSAFSAVMTELLPAGVLPGMAGDLGVSQGRVGFLVSLYAAASFLAAIPLTAALRGCSRRTVLLGVLVGFALCNTVTAVSPWYPLTCGVRVLAGVMGGVLWAMLVGYAARMVPAHRRGRAIALVLAGNTLALAGGVPLGNALSGLVGWRLCFGLLAALAALLTLWVRLGVPDFPGERSHQRVPLATVATAPGLRPVLSVTLLLLCGHQALYTYLDPYTEDTGLGPASWVLMTFGVATVAGVWAGGALVDRLLRPTLLGSLALVVGAMLVLGWLGGQPTLLFAAVAGWGVAFGAAPTLLQTALVDISGPRRADVATSMQATVYNGGIASGALVGGLALEGLGVAALPWTALPLVSAALCVVLLGRRYAFPRQRAVRETSG